jgi:hypothetical protein
MFHGLFKKIYQHTILKMCTHTVERHNAVQWLEVNGPEGHKWEVELSV